MNNPNNDLFNTNYSFVKNNETFNQKLFDRNFLSSQMAQKPNFNPTYFISSSSCTYCIASK